MQEISSKVYQIMFRYLVVKSFLYSPLPHLSIHFSVVLSSHCVKQCVSTQTERLSVPLNSPSSIVFIWMLFQAKPGTGLDFRSPKCEPRELDSSGKGEQREMERHSEAKQTQISWVYFKSPCLILTAVLQASD